MAMMKTCCFVPFSEAFDASSALKGSRIESTELELYERPSDKILSNLLEYDIIQNGLFRPVVRKIRIDCFKKRVSIIDAKGSSYGGFEGKNLKSFKVDSKDTLLVRMYVNGLRGDISFHMESPELIEKLFESLNYLLEVSNGRK